MIKESKLVLLLTQEMNESRSLLKKEAGKNGNTLPITDKTNHISPRHYSLKSFKNLFSWTRAFRISPSFQRHKACGSVPLDLGLLIYFSPAQSSTMFYTYKLTILQGKKTSCGCCIFIFLNQYLRVHATLIAICNIKKLQPRCSLKYFSFT